MSKNILKPLIKANVKRSFESIIEEYEQCKEEILLNNKTNKLTKLERFNYNSDYLSKKEMLFKNKEIRNILIELLTNQTIGYIQEYDVKIKYNQDLLENQLYLIIFEYIDKIDIDNKN